jgi:glycosyltransferase involved in cell wall biosynthesis
MERLLADLVRRVDRERFEPHVLVLQYLGRFAEGLEAVAGVHVAGAMPRWSLLWPGPLIAQIRGIAPDVVHSHSGVWYKTSLAARRAGVPVIIHTDHGRQRPDPWQARLIDGLASRRTDVVVAVSDVLARQLTGSVVARGTRVRVVTNGVDTDAFRPRADDGVVRAALGIARDAPVVGSIGRLEPIKGYDVLLDAFVQLRLRWGKGTPPVLALAGEGSEGGRLEAAARAAGVAGDVRFLGWRDDVHALHAAFTVFAMGSRSEGTSVSLLEAMSAGVVPVVTAVGGNAAVLGPELAHRLVPAEDPGSLARGLAVALADAEARARDAAAARARVVRAFSVAETVRQYEEIYERRWG